MTIRTVLLFGQDPFTERLLGMLSELDTDVDARLLRNASPAALTMRDLDGVHMLLVDGDRVAVEESHLLKERTAKLPHLAIAAFGSEEDLGVAQQFQREHGITYIPKAYGRPTIVAALRLVLSSVTPEPEHDEIVPSPVEIRAAGNESHVPSLKDLGLTDAESEVLGLAAQGKTNHEIADALGKSEGTVRIQMTSILKKLKVRNRSEAIIVAMRVIKVVRTQIEHARTGDLDIGWLLPHMEFRRYPAGTTLFMKGDIADELYLIQRGRVSLVELGKELGEHDMFGEIGIFAPDHKRTCSARAATDLDLFALSEDKVKQAYFLNPSFAMYVLHTITSRLMTRAPG
ncbi:MAG: LuxR C-terminal-related transcriptional regulator [Burkholderiales bacterium]